MASRLATALVLGVTAIAGHAAANGRSPSAQSISFRQGDPQYVVVGATFGALTSADGGATWRWTCEAAVGYGGIYDPDYAYASSGAIAATTLNGLRIDRDGCAYEPTALGSVYVSQVEVSSMATHVAMSAPTDSTIYTSTDDGLTFPTTATPGLAGDVWTSLVAAPSEATRLYLSGYRIDDGVRVFLLFTSDDGGGSFTPMSTSGLQVSQGSIVTIAGVAAATPTTVYAIVTFENSVTVDGVYASTDAGASWTRMIGGTQPLAFLARSTGQLVVAGPALAKVSTDGTIWSDLPSPPPITCLAERADGVVWACTRDLGGDRIMRTIDLASWTSVLRFADIAGPVLCPAGTVQHDTCEAQWCFLRTQLAITADPTGCDATDGTLDGVTDAAVERHDAGTSPPATSGCCDATGQGGATSLWLAACVVAASRRRQRPAR